MGISSAGPRSISSLATTNTGFMSDADTIQAVLDDEDDDGEVVLNRARLYHDRRDFYIQDGDTGMRDDYPGPPWWMKRDEARSDDNDDN